ncbi:MAG: sugar phosphate nucleotidyltransferase [Anaerolineales bacterium]
MTETLKIVIPMAGWGTRMRPHTWSKPKPLVNVAGKTSFEHLMDLFDTLPEPSRTEYVFIVGPYLGETQIPAFVEKHYPDINAHFVVQGEMKGQSHALYLARQYLTGPMVMLFSDTLIETDFSFLDREKSDGVAWVKAVEDPRRFGVVDVNEEGWIKRLIEKPDTKENNLALVGCYYFKSGENLMAAIEEQMQQDMKLKNEFFLADAINILLERGALMRVESVDVWLDTGTIDATLETNAILLERMDVTPDERPGVKVLPPVFIHPTSEVSESVIGPNVSIGADCKITQAVIQDSIIAEDTHISQAALTHSLIGSDCVVEGLPDKEEPSSLNIGDNSEVRFEA